MAINPLIPKYMLNSFLETIFFLLNLDTNIGGLKNKNILSIVAILKPTFKDMAKLLCNKYAISWAYTPRTMAINMLPYKNSLILFLS